MRRQLGGFEGPGNFERLVMAGADGRIDLAGPGCLGAEALDWTCH